MGRRTGRGYGYIEKSPNLLTLERPDGMTHKAFRAFVRYATEFLVNEGLLFRRAKLNMPPRRVIWDRNKQNNII